MPLSPLFVAGHHVGTPEMASVGVREQYMAYAAGSSTVALVKTSALREDFKTPWPMSRFKFVSLTDSSGSSGASASQISVVQLHPSADWLCVGTQHSGMYLTSVLNPVLSPETRLPIDATGESIHCACFITDSAEGTDGAAEYVAFSSSFHSCLENRSPHRLSLWGIRHRCVVWRGASDPLHGMCSLSPELAFAACTSEKMISIFSVRIKDHEAASVDSPNSTESTMEPEDELASRFLVVSRTCATSDMWGARPAFVSCALTPPTPYAEGSFVALTSSGILVEFHKVTGAILKWMDCKDTRATSVLVTRKVVAVSGEAVRYFDSSSWEFCGKHHFDAHSWNGSVNSIVGVFSVVLQTRSICLLSNGSVLVYEVTKGADALPPHKGLHFNRVYSYFPLVDDGIGKAHPMHWIHPAVDGVAMENTACALWGPPGIRVVDSTDLHFETQSPLRFNCGAYNVEWNLFLAQCTQTRQVIAFDPQDFWEQKAAVDTPCALVSMTVNDEGTLAALGNDQMIYYISCRWIMSGVGCVSSLVLEHKSQMELNGGEFHSIHFVSDRLYAISSRRIMDTSSLQEQQWKESILRVESIGNRLLLLFSNHCEFFDPTAPHDFATAVTLPFTASSAASLVVEPTQRRLVLVQELHQIIVFHTNGGGAPLLFFEHPTGMEVKLAAFCGAGKGKWRLVVADTTGMTGVYGLDTKTKRSSRRQASPLLAGEGLPLRPSAKSRQANNNINNNHVERDLYDDVAIQPRKAAAAAPSSDQLSDRFSELSNFYKSQTAGATTPRSHGGSRSAGKSDAPAPPPAAEPGLGFAAAGISAAVPGKQRQAPAATAAPSWANAGDSIIEISALTITTTSANAPRSQAIAEEDTVRQECDVDTLQKADNTLSDGDDPIPRPEMFCHAPERPPCRSTSPVQARTASKVEAGKRSEEVQHRDPNANVVPLAEALRHRAASLRETLLELNGQGSDGVQDAVVENSSTLQELYDVLALTLRRSGVFASTSGGLDQSVTTPSVTASTVMTADSLLLHNEIRRIQEQNQRLEAQNTLIMQALNVKLP